MAFHALIGAGFLAATFLVRPFLPDNKNMDIDQICGRANQTDSSTSSAQDTEESGPRLGYFKIFPPRRLNQRYPRCQKEFPP